MMNAGDFAYGSFCAVKEKEDLFPNFLGEFKPVVLSEKQKKRLRKIAEKAAKINKKNELIAQKIAKKQAKENERLRHSKEKKVAKQEIASSKVKRPIGQKLISIISAIVIISLGCLTFIVYHFISEDTKTNAEANNLTVAIRTAGDCEKTLQNIVSTVDSFVTVFNSETNFNEIVANENASVLFGSNPEIVAISFPQLNKSYENLTFFGEHEIETSLVDSYLQIESDSIQNAEQGIFSIQNATPIFGADLMALFIPVSKLNNEKSVMILYSSEKLFESFSSGAESQTSETYFVNGNGIVIVASNSDLMAKETDFSENGTVKEMLSEKQDNDQTVYSEVDENGRTKEFLGAYKKISFGNSGVVTIVQSDIILAGVRRTTRFILYISISILSISIMIIYFFSKSMSVPLKQLTAVVNQINEGNFNTELFGDLKTNGKDEIGVLINSTKNEREILNTFTKLTNKGVTQAIIKKAIDFDPHLKDITIFFSDIRGFTAISDGFKKKFGEKSAAEIINFLNDYMSRMVTCITRTGGTVDKFEGDAIMACWGVLRQEPLDWEKLPDSDPKKAEAKAKHDAYVKEDALSAIKASLAMRYSLMEYNKEATAFTKAHENNANAEYKPQIKIGRGINTGRATVGFMGSYDKMEFTSIGDAVNFASRTEASNKPCGTDMLITEDTYNLIKKDYIKCAENNFTISEENKKNEIVVEMIPVEFEVKGKGKQHFYGVVNMPQFDIKEFFAVNNPFFEPDPDCEKALGPKGPETIQEVRELLGIPTPDFEKVNLNEEENKIQVASK